MSNVMQRKFEASVQNLLPITIWRPAMREQCQGIHVTTYDLR